MGHMLSGNILPPRDDSCLARSGCMALEMFDSLRFNRWINADYWVIMLGVNSHYSWLEEDYCRRIMDTTHYRNPDGETYFLNGLPLPDSVPLGMPTRVQLTGFNTWLDAMADVRRNAGWKLYVVNACSTMSVDTVSNDTLFYDCLHPNQLGYDRLSQAIWAKMLSH